MSRRCSLCDPERTTEEANLLWWAMQEAGPAGVVYTAARVGVSTSAEEAKLHFDSHHAIQAPARNPLHRREALVLADSLSDRQRSILELCFRSRGISAEQITTMLYSSENLRSARASSARDLKKLVWKDLLYRVDLGRLPGEGPRPRIEPPTLYFLGRQSLAQIERSYGRKPRKREEWISEIGDLGEWDLLHERWLAGRVATDLISQLPDFEPSTNTRSLSGGGWRVEVSAENWFDGRFCRKTFADPIRRASSIKADGLIALGITRPQAPGSLVPCFYHLDRGTRPLARMISRLTAHAALQRTCALAGMFESLPAAHPCAVLVVCEDQARAEGLVKESRRTVMPPDITVLAATRSALEANGMIAPCWRPLFRDAKACALIPALSESAAAKSGLSTQAVLLPQA